MKSNPKLIAFTCFLFLLSNAIVYSQKLAIAVEDDAAPWSQKDGNGYANDVVRAAFKAVGEEVVLEVVPYSRGKEMVMSGKVAACFSMAWLTEFQEKVIFPQKPLFTCYNDFFAQKSNPSKVTRIENFKKGTKLGVVIGYEYPPYVYQLRDKGILIFEESESEVVNLKKLALGRIDYALINHNETKPDELLIARAGATGKIIKSVTGNTLDCYIGFSTKHPQGAPALKKFNKGMQIIRQNGTLKKITKKWKEKAHSEIKKLNAPN
ncbi:MAG: substrate-binding periplasmic protein [Flavobacterium sp.]